MVKITYKLGFLLLLISSLSAFSQIKIELRVDSLLFSEKPIYMASSINNWNPKDPAWQLRKIDQGLYSIEIPEKYDSFEYKFTQGNWNNVEGRKSGALLPNRVYSKFDAENGILKLKIEGWEHRPEFQLHLTKIPENTPEDASIYVCGEFNDWEEGDPQFKLEKQFDGTYKIKIFSKSENLLFKFNRGNWRSAESWKNGKPRPNRIIEKSKTNSDEAVTLEIENWEDLSSSFNFYSIIDLLLLFAAFQGILLMIAVPSMQDFNLEANRLLVAILGLGSLFMFLRVVGNYREVANALPKLVLIPNFLMFTFAPLFYLYLNKLLFKKVFSVNEVIPHLILPFLLAIAYIPYYFMDGKRFQHKVVNYENDLKWVFAFSFAIALFSNLYYYYISRKAIKKYSESYINETAYHQNINYLSTVLSIYLGCIVLGIFSAGVFLANIFNNWQSINLLDNSINMVWIAFSLIGYLLGYYAIHQPEIFKITSDEMGEEINLEVEDSTKPDSSKNKSHIAENDLENYTQKIDEVMTNEKPFLDPNLTLNDLAGSVKIPSHVLSKVIKEGYNKNFFDFVNSYRIEEFKKNINNPKYHNYTLLGIAFEVGFNSKTAFNRSFKKITNQTPSEYYQSRK